MKTSDLIAIVGGMTESPWSTEKPPRDENDWALGATVAATSQRQRIYSPATHGTSPAADRQGIAVLRNHADALVGLLEAVEQVLAADGPEDHVATRRALLAAYARVMAVP